MFKAKTQKTDAEGAETVAENRHTEVERPLDMEEAEEVEEEKEEEFAGEGEATNKVLHEWTLLPNVRKKL